MSKVFIAPLLTMTIISYLQQLDRFIDHYKWLSGFQSASSVLRCKQNHHQICSGWTEFITHHRKQLNVYIFNTICVLKRWFNCLCQALRFCIVNIFKHISCKTNQKAEIMNHYVSVYSDLNSWCIFSFSCHSDFLWFMSDMNHRRTSVLQQLALD